MIDLNLVIEVLIIIFKVVFVTMVLFSLPMPLTWIERKVAGHMQARLGPWRVGPHGLLQPLADTIKLLLKEDIVPENADKFLFKLAPIISMVPAFAVFVAIPVGDSFKIPFIEKTFTLYISDMNVGILYVLAIGGLSIYGIILGGWASNSKYSLLGGLRSAAQMISYEVALSFAAIGVVMMTNSLSLVDMVRAQDGGFWHWNILYLPVGPVWFAVFFIAALAEINRVPFDLPEDEGTLAAGYHTEYSGMRFSFFMLTEYVAMVTASALAVVMFFGGWNAPIDFRTIEILTPITSVSWIYSCFGLFWFTVKVSFFIYLFMWIRFTLPRYRYDQLMTVGWKILIPICLGAILVTGFMRI
ncbi:NADH-quinone oxidoreductase subunit NuoH [bacterium]|nr:MAG: NADH-quinone oxidoreductase subunit NuoH [bacterium]